MAVTQLKDGRWLVYYRSRRPDGKPYLEREYFGRGPGAEAKARDRDRELGLSRRRPAKTAEGPTFAEIARDYFRVHQFASVQARDQHRIRMTTRLLPFFGPMTATRVNDADLERYIKARRTTPFRKNRPDCAGYSTIRRELVDLKAIFNFAFRRRPPLIAFNPVRDFRLPREELEVILPPTPDEFAAILAAAPDHLRRICLIAYYCGLRPGPVECYRLRWEMVDWSTGTILIQSARKGGPVARSVPIHPDFMPVMRQWHKVDGANGIPWIVSWAGKTVKKISTTWAYTLKQAGITRRLRPYDVRHLFVTQALERGADIGALADVVGSSPQTLRKFYQHVATPMLRRTVNLIPTVAIPADDTEKGITK
jgi:integrase